MARGGKREGAGRPRKHDKPDPTAKRLPWRPSKYDPAFCDMVIEATRGGFSLTGFAGSIGVSRATINNWQNDFPEFLEACSISKASRTHFWEEKAAKVGDRGGGPGTSSMIQFMLKNNAPDEYTDRQKVEHSGGIPIVIAPRDADL